VPEAPTDAKAYVRQSSAWTDLATVSISNIANNIVTFAKMAAAAIATAADYRANTASKILTTDQVWAAAVPVALTDAGTVTISLATGIDFLWAMTTGAHTIANPTNGKAGQKGLIFLVQPGGGGGVTMTWGTNFKFPGGVKPTLSSAANAVDIISYTVGNDNATMWCFSGIGMA
jgi:hypothetical protein